MREENHLIDLINVIWTFDIRFTLHISNQNGYHRGYFFQLLEFQRNSEMGKKQSNSKQ